VKTFGADRSAKRLKLYYVDLEPFFYLGKYLPVIDRAETLSAEKACGMLYTNALKNGRKSCIFNDIANCSPYYFMLFFTCVNNV
jgi:hypothetical protein